MSKFDKLFEARAGLGDEPERLSTENLSEPKKISKKSGKIFVEKVEKIDGALSASAATPPNPEPVKPRGRPKAKRSDPDFVGFTTYIRRDTHLKAKIALLQEGGGRELSELVESLLHDWLKAKN